MRVELTEDLDLCRALRRKVFIDEQGVPEEIEMDDLDGQALHLLLWQDGEAVGSARVQLMGKTGKIGRVCVLPVERGGGFGTALMRAAVDVLRAQPGLTRAQVGAQVQALGFYEKLGFAPQGDVYDEAGIPHQNMIRDL